MSFEIICCQKGNLRIPIASGLETLQDAEACLLGLFVHDSDLTDLTIREVNHEGQGEKCDNCTFFGYKT